MDFIREKWGIPIRDIWFKKSHETVGFSLLNIFYNFYETLDDCDGIALKKWQSKTFVSDISVSPEEIQAKFKSKVRNEIRRAIKEGITTKVFYAAELEKNDIIDNLDKAYIAMYQDKGQKTTSIAMRLRGIARAGRLSVSIAYLPDNSIASYHSYVIGDEVARLLHSVSVFREEPEKRKMIGWANRLLHFEDMCSFKMRGCLVYDWGGLSRDDNMSNITRFKEEFGGKEKNVYYCISLKIKF